MIRSLYIQCINVYTFYYIYRSIDFSIPFACDDHGQFVYVSILTTMNLSL